LKLSDCKSLIIGLWSKVKAFVYSHSAEEWKSFFGGKISAVRSFAQDNGEKAAAFGFLLGILIVFFFKLFVISAVVVSLIILTIIIAADSRPDDWQA